MNKATQNYVRQHADDDVRLLALRGSKDPNVDLTQALQQIQGRQTARRKIPSWAAVDAMLYPPHLNMEQCSSELTARYKAQIAARLVNGASHEPTAGSSLVDLTGGFGVDFAFMQEAFDEATYVERNPQLFAISSQNFASLGLRVGAVNADAQDFLSALQQRATLIFLDPARRDDHGGRTYALSDCTPDVLQLLPQLLQKSAHVLLKLSPMLDWRKAMADLGADHVAEVHIVSVGNECREMLVVLQPTCDETAFFCVNDGQTLRFSAADVQASLPPTAIPQAGHYLYEPNASLMKAGCFGALSRRYGVSPVARDSHLFLSDRLLTDFPGRCFLIETVTSMGKRELRQALGTLSQANITTRNFPLSVADLRRRLKLSEGGSKYLFATTLASGDRVLIVTRRP